jgi:hypothetical protein
VVERTAWEDYGNTAEGPPQAVPLAGVFAPLLLIVLDLFLGRLARMSAAPTEAPSSRHWR